MTNRSIIAHLSDVHIGNHEPAVLQQLKASLLQTPRPTFLVVTGDLSEHSRVPELQQAQAFLCDVVGCLREMGHPARYIVIPGNHDVGYWKRQQNWRQVFESWGGGAVTDACQPHHLSAADERYCECYPNAGLVFLKFDSNILPGNLLNYANGNVGSQQIDRMKQALARHEAADSRFKEYRRIALVHHHVHYLPMTESDKLFLMRDAGLFWREMIDLDVELILHGHKHYATHAILRFMRPTEGPTLEERELMILSAGTATSRDRPTNQRNSYYKIECDAFKYRVQHFAVEAVSFVLAGPPIVCRTIPQLCIPGASAAIDMAALEAILVPDDTDCDTRRYTQLTYEAMIGRDLSYTKRATFEGIHNTAGAAHLDVPFVVVGAPARMRSMDWTAYDCHANQPLAKPIVTPHAENISKVICRISLPPLRLGERFCVRFEGRVPDLMYRENDFDAVGIARFTGGLDQFKYVLRSELMPIEPRCFAIHRNGPRPLEFDYEVTQPNSGPPIYEIRPRIPNIAALGLGVLCHYQRLIDSVV